MRFDWYDLLSSLNYLAVGSVKATLFSLVHCELAVGTRDMNGAVNAKQVLQTGCVDLHTDFRHPVH